ncbi:molybdenum ABC transporter ATP-binding protein [Marimonas lutisalis]|uniref:molybdenum ABC transporter ATP-binding protein n=1 Tax=Marimonas lutisalis TaxID=2545756 RepID=UPI0010F6F87E|nr:molybdenum ABC transporter ATP-binding protein [Marimonas lutisalis]
MTLTLDIRQRLGAFTLEAAFQAGPGVTALFGASGAGKSSIVNAIAGLSRPDAGRIAFAGSDLFNAETGTHLLAHHRRVGVVFQDNRLFPHFSVAQNIRYGARLAGGVDAAQESRITDLLGITALMNRRPGALSGGEKSRVALARALLMRPRLLLMDEPLAALDGPRKEEILPYLERLRDQAGPPILYVSHSVAEIARLSDHIVMLDQGRVLRAGPAQDLLSDPALMPQFGIREAGAILTATVEAHAPDGLSRLRISGGALWVMGVGAPVGTRLRLRLLASDIILAAEAPRAISARNVLPVTVETVQQGHGPGAAVSLRCGEDRLLARITSRAVAEIGLEPGRDCFAILKATAIARSDIGSVQA